MCPCHPRGRPSSCASQSSVTCSSSVAAGEVDHAIAFTLNAAISSSARMPGSEPVMPKYAKKRGWFQCVSAGAISSFDVVAAVATNSSPCSGGDSGSAARTSPGATARHHRPLAAPC